MTPETFADSRPDAGLALRRAVAEMVLLRNAMSQPSPSTVALLIQREGLSAGEEIEKAKRQDREFLRENGLWEHLTSTEKEFMESDMTQVTVGQLRSVTPLVESLCCLVWALGLLDAIPPYDEQSDMRGPCQVISRDLSEALGADVALREPEELERARVTAERWLWRSRVRELQENGYLEGENGSGPLGMPAREAIKTKAAEAFDRGEAPPPVGDDFSVLGRPYRSLTGTEWSRVRSIAMERYRALSWLCGRASGNRWESTPVDDLALKV